MPAHANATEEAREWREGHTGEEAVSESATKRRYGLGFWCAIVFLTLAVYVAAYALMIRRIDSLSTTKVPYDPRKSSVAQTHPMRWEGHPSYFDSRTMSDILAAIFQPLHVIDRHLRSTFWEPKLFEPTPDSF